MKNYICPICGYPELDGNSKDTAYAEFCPSCRFQFHVTDDDKGYTHQQWRDEWVKKGMPWGDVGIQKPVGWNPAKQLENLKNLPPNDE